MSWFGSLGPTLQGVLLGQLGPFLLLLIGGLGWLIQHRIQANARQRDHTRQKLEQVLDALFLVDAWIDDQFKQRASGKVVAIQSPALRVHGLVNAYYPELASQATALHKASLAWVTNFELLNYIPNAGDMNQYTIKLVEAQHVLIDAVSAALRKLSR